MGHSMESTSNRIRISPMCIHWLCTHMQVVVYPCAPGCVPMCTWLCIHMHGAAYPHACGCVSMCMWPCIHKVMYPCAHGRVSQACDYISMCRIWFCAIDMWPCIHMHVAVYRYACGCVSKYPWPCIHVVMFSRAHGCVSHAELGYAL
jgi:hypothetical protein